MMNVGTAGLRPIAVAGATTPAAIAASTPLTLPTATQRLKFGGVLVVMIVLEGTASVRYTTNGVTPTAAIGVLTPTPSATNPVVLWFEGDDVISALRLIQTAATTTMTYQFYQKDSRL